MNLLLKEFYLNSNESSILPNSGPLFVVRFKRGEGDRPKRRKQDQLSFNQHVAHCSVHKVHKAFCSNSEVDIAHKVYIWEAYQVNFLMGQTVCDLELSTQSYGKLIECCIGWPNSKLGRILNPNLGRTFLFEIERE